MLSLKFLVLNSNEWVLLNFKGNRLVLNHLFVSINISFITILRCFIIRVGYYYTCIVHKQDDVSIFSCCLGQIIDIKKKKQRAKNGSLWNPTFNLFPAWVWDLIVSSCVINMYSEISHWGMILSTNKISQQSHKILICLVVFCDLYSQKLSPGHKMYPSVTFCYSLQLEFINLYDATAVAILGLKPCCNLQVCHSCIYMCD